MIDKMYFSLAPNKLDIDIIMNERPQNILVSYALWSKEKGKNKLSNIVKYFWKNKYYPNIMLDSGAYTFRGDSQKHSFLDLISPYVYEIFFDYDLGKEFKTFGDCLVYYIDLIVNKEIDHYWTNKQGVEVNLKDYPNLLDFLEFISINRHFVKQIVSLDDINSDKMSLDNWIVIRNYFDNTVPTFHYGESFETLDLYVIYGATYIGLGGIALAKSSGAKFKDIIGWINKCTERHPTVKFHLFGCQDYRIINHISIHSADGASWIISAAMKSCKSEKSKFELACENIRNKDIKYKIENKR